jgi:LacI family transcriptional regulator
MSRIAVHQTVTMSDVARAAGVSKAAVSVVLHGTGKGSTRVSEATRQRVLKIARDLQYTPNGIARALRRRTTNVVGLYLGDRYLDTHGRFMAEIVGGLQLGCHKHQKDLLIHGSFRGQSVNDIYSELVDGRIDGLVLFVELGDPLASRLSASSLPVIALADAAPGLPSVVVADEEGSVSLADYLIGKGHRSILYRKGPQAQTSARRRYAAFHERALAGGIQLLEDPELYCGGFDAFSARERSYLCAPGGERPTAIVCWVDTLADQSVLECQHLGLQVPQEIAVVGFDGLRTDYKPALRLTTIRAPWSEVAETSVDLLVKRLRGEEIPQETVLPVEFVLGDTA